MSDTGADPTTTPDRTRRTWIAIAAVVVIAGVSTIAVIRNGARTSPPAPPPIDAQLLPAAPVATDAGGDEAVRPPAPVLIEDGASPVLVELVGVDGTALDVPSLFALRIIVRDDGAFLEVDQTAAVVPDGVAMWVVRVDGQLKMQATARTGSIDGIGVTDDEVANGVQVTIEGIDADGAVIAASTPTTAA